MYLPRIAGGFFLFAKAYAAIGPNADLFIGNKVIQPDGFSRS
jgi:iron transport multicopper oxidase